MDSARTPLTAQFIQGDDDDEFDEEHIPGFSHPAVAQSPLPKDKGKTRAREPEQLAPPTGNIGSSSSNVSGNFGSLPGRSAGPTRQTVGGVRVETRFTGVDTLDEPVSATIARDLWSIYTKLVQVLYPPKSSSREVLRDWDLWGPLMLCLALGIMLSINAPSSQALGVFTSVIVICSLGAFTVTVQAKLLGGRVSFFQGLCVLGYCIAPLDIAALISCFIRVIYIRAPLALLAWGWCIWAAIHFLDGAHIGQPRLVLAVYPLLLFYFILAWMILIQ
ncbi:Yip1-domain-containing protein [Pluteus cervinus]|uniref:Yip1-domain-containing protein n=1 Tax=Pluteus cervinus TaxID=181527 RepID=A0ACD3BAZ5_9AGAR|nr:Yip1-domain-containing protein [Pluteus cervinus]